MSSNQNLSTSSTHLQEHTFATAEEFLNEIRLSNRRWSQHNVGPDTWGFRGQSDREWRLMPSALRPGTRLGYGVSPDPIFSNGKPGDYDQMNGEFVVMYQFLEMADKIGLTVPGDQPRQRLNKLTGREIGGIIGTGEWPMDDHLETLAIAQHHGVPTRLLDFTYRPFIAAFFAAADADHRMQQDIGATTNADEQMFSVWGVDLSFLTSCGIRFQIVNVPRARNPFLHAQHGFFILVRHPRDEANPCLDEEVMQEFAAHVQRGAESVSPPLVKFSAPWCCAGKLLALLEREGIDFPHLMPSFTNVVRHLERRTK